MKERKTEQFEKFIKELRQEFRRYRYCQLVGNNCCECKYHKWVFKDGIFAGNECSY